jgi:Zn finger protein HypA/HybF involved in hydrogenase expression
MNKLTFFRGSVKNGLTYEALLSIVSVSPMRLKASRTDGTGSKTRERGEPIVSAAALFQEISFNGVTRRQTYLPTMEPAIIPVCAHCHQPRGKVMQEREGVIAAVRATPGQFCHPTADRQRLGVCCTPDSEYRCPRCHSMRLQFGMYEELDFDGCHSHEAAHCDDCRWTGDAQDTMPPEQPWAELEAVAATLRQTDKWESEPQICQPHATVLREVA